MKQRFIKTIGAALLGLSIVGCDTDELLDKSPVTELSGDSYNTEPNLMAALYASYDVLQWQVMDGVHVFPLMWQGIRADDLHSQFANFWTPGTIMDDFSLMQSNNVSVQKLWQKWYGGVSRANIVIAKAQEFDGWETEGLQAQVIAEAKTLRAFFYFELVRMWGGVPLITEPIASPSEIPSGERATAAQIYAQIDADLMDAVDDLPTKSGTVEGRVTKGLAQTLLAKSKLYQEDYASVIAYTEAVINSGEYALEEDFGRNFKLDNENGKESILEIQYEDGFSADFFEVASQSQQGSGMWQMCYPWIFGRWTSWSNMLPLGELVDQYDKVNDVRYEDTFISVGMDIRGDLPNLAANWCPPRDYNGDETISADEILATDGVVLDWNVSWLRPNLEDCNYTRKYIIDWDVLDGLLQPSQSPLNEKIIRYSEVLLMHAEASAMGGGGNGLASLNAVRERAGLTALGSYTMDDVKSERRKELATEGWNRFSDVVRWGDATSNATFQRKNFQSGRDELLPIPQSEIDVVGADILQQNPGY
ncbi:RagB/SusD family nutrient uptake outer membrane protein [Sediminitomix flava]|uniref:Putative outer membrane starch-binding protein n=1 Tax=Sediminitomix flava TaxID=379075 RepID=A0A315ZB19_SEDFL|nr:RagB/SusD family nutrient uptake outer membrane protein [Sediminitomix flava]PWJ41914.1 putative outer membrane starch-binding protein [Sediminitomix flava]